VLYHLASKTHYLVPLREEAEEQLSDDPTRWTREALSRCIKLDSFIMESLRLNGLSAVWMPRLAVKDFEFSDGTVIPAGNFVAVAVSAVHEDVHRYEQPETFDGFRFASAFSDEEASSLESAETKTDSRPPRCLTGPSPDYLTFGGGRHLWYDLASTLLFFSCLFCSPGRFLASTLMKAMLTYIILNYDIRTQVEGIRPPDEWLGPTSNPCTRAAILFRRRTHRG
jgi:hypothetical protein